ncbi:MAX geneassociated proteinlike, partial [Caligus rogercresseyi]
SKKRVREPDAEVEPDDEEENHAPSSKSFFLFFNEDLTHKRIPQGISRVLLRFKRKDGKSSLTKHVALPPLNASQFWNLLRLNDSEQYTYLHWKGVHLKTSLIANLLEKCMKGNTGKRLFLHVPGLSKNFSFIAIPGLGKYVFAGPFKDPINNKNISDATDVMTID